MVWESYGVGGRQGRTVNSLYEKCQACVRVLGQNSDWFGVQGGEWRAGSEARLCNVPMAV